MNEARELIFDGAGIGRPSKLLGLVHTAYGRLERRLTRLDLRSFHFEGAEVLGNQGSELEYMFLRSWRGFEGLEWKILEVLGLDYSRHRSALIYYGSETGALFRAILPTVTEQSILWADSFYEPWRRMFVAKYGARNEMKLQGGSSGQAERIVEAILSLRPRVVCLPIVTRMGTRIPIEDVCELLNEEWPKASHRWHPLLVFDGCQAFGRVPVNLGSPVLLECACAFIGCLHKAIHGPKEMAFLICTNAGWLKELKQACYKGQHLPGISAYARTNGNDPGLSTVDLARAIGAGIVLDNWSIERIRYSSSRIRANERAFRRALNDSGWTPCGSLDEALWSGIVPLVPPQSLSALCHAESLAEFLAAGSPPIIVDQVKSMVRIAFDGDHEGGTGELLGNILSRTASEKN